MDTRKRWSGKTNFLLGIVLAILPKCPFCVMAYTGAVTMCSGKKIYPNDTSAYTILMIAVAIIIFLGIALNPRGIRTRLAMLFALLGITCIFTSQYIAISEEAYYFGTFLLLFGVWVNGSFLYFYTLIRKKIQQLFLTKLNKI